MSTKLDGICGAQARFCAAFVQETAEKVLRTGDAADRAASLRFKEDRRIGSRDRRFISNTLFAWFRWYGWLCKAGLQNNWPAALAVASLLDDNASGAVRFWAHSAEISDAQFEKAARTASLTERFSILTGVSVSLSDLLPEWAVELLPESLRSEERLFEYLQKRSPMWLRAQTNRIPELLNDLMKNGFVAEKHERVPSALKIADARGNLYASPEFLNGLFEIQDFSSQCIGMTCMARPEESWWDACAGGGGKTLQLASMMERKGSICATDIRGYKLEDLKRRAARAAYPNIRCKEWDGATVPDRAGFDGVLIDAPCSSSGRWRRNPDGRWTSSPDHVAELCGIQRGILEHACAGVKPGGVLVYATCSLFECENESVVHSFLESHPEFKLEPFPSPWSGEQTNGMLRTSPWHADCDASFAARMRRSK